jgi:hypothetical protein
MELTISQSWKAVKRMRIAIAAMRDGKPAFSSPIAFSFARGQPLACNDEYKGIHPSPLVEKLDHAFLRAAC